MFELQRNLSKIGIYATHTSSQHGREYKSWLEVNANEWESVPSEIKGQYIVEIIEKKWRDGDVTKSEKIAIVSK